MIGEANVSGQYSCVAQNEEGSSTLMFPFYVDGKWVTRNKTAETSQSWLFLMH